MKAKMKVAKMFVGIFFDFWEKKISILIFVFSYEYNRPVSFSSSKAWINLYVKNQRRQDYPFQCNTAFDNSNNDGELTVWSFDSDLKKYPLCLVQFLSINPKKMFSGHVATLLSSSDQTKKVQVHIRKCSVWTSI